MTGIIIYQARYVFLPIILMLIAQVLAYRLYNALGETYRISTQRSLDRNPGNTELREAMKYRRAKAGVTVWVMTAITAIIIGTQAVSLLPISLTAAIPAATLAAGGLAFGLQWIFKDLFQGIAIITEKQYGIGDNITIGTPGSDVGVTGEVEQVTLRVTKIRTIRGSLVNVSNRNIEQVTNLSNAFSTAVVEVPIPPLSNDMAEEAMSCLNRVCDTIHTDPAFRGVILEKPIIKGVVSLEPTYDMVRITCDTLPDEQWDVEREIRRLASLELANKGINRSDITPALS